MALSQADLDKLNSERAVAYNSGKVPATRNKVSISIDPTTRKINIQVPDWYAKTKEFNEQVLPSFQSLVGKNVSDTQFKALMDAGMQDDIQSQVDGLTKRQGAIDQYRAKYTKATDDDAMTYFRNVAAAQNSDNDSNTQVVLGYKADGTPDTRSVKDALKNFNGYSDKQKGDMLAKTEKTLADPNISENVRAATLGLHDFLQAKGAFKAQNTTIAEQGLTSALAKSDEGALGGALNLFSRGINAIQGKGWQSIAEQNKADLTKTNLDQLEGVEQARQVGETAIGGVNTAGEIVATLPLGGAGAVAKIGTLGRTGKNAVETLNALEKSGKIGQVAAGTIKSLPSDIAFSAADSVNNPDVNGVQTLGENVAGNVALLGGAKLVGRALKAVDTTSGGVLTRISRDTGRLGLRGVQKIESIPGFDKLASSFSRNFIDEDAVVKRTFRNAYANAKGEKNIEKARGDYIEINNALRLATQKGAGEQALFRAENPNYNAAITDNTAIEKSGLNKEAADYVNKYVTYQRAVAGQYQMPEEAFNELALQVKNIEATHPEFVQYKDNIVKTTKDITNIGTEAGILDDDIIDYMEKNPEFAKDYIALQTDLTARKLPYKPGASSPKNLKNTTPVKKIKGQTDEELQDPFLVMNQRLAAITRIKADNRVAAMVGQGIQSGAIGGRFIRSAPEVKALNDLKFSKVLEQEAVDRALAGQLKDLGGTLTVLSDDLEDFAGSGQKIVENRINSAVDDMVDTILDDPKLQDEITNLMDDFGDGREGAENAAGYGIMYRNRQRISAAVGEELAKSELGATQQKQVLEMFKQAVVNHYDDAMTANGRTAYTGARILNERSNEIKRLNAEMGGTTELKGKNVVAYYGEGQKGYYELDDPELADYFNSRKPPVEDGLIARFMTASSRLFRAGTTGLDPIYVLFINPLRDVPQAFVAAGTGSRGFITPGRVIETLMEARGMTREAATEITERIARQKKETYEFGTFVSAGRGDVNAQIKKPWWQSQEGYNDKLDKKAYDKLVAEHRDNSRGKFKYVVNMLVPRRALRNVEDIMGNVELATRSQVYNSRFLDAISQGKSVDDAMSEALFYGTETTTNFLNSGAKLKQFARTVPYLQSAINGSASFARLFALDPVGVTLRMAGGVAMPVVYLTAMNLKDEETAAAYGDIPEYTRNTNFVIMLNKDTPLLIPMSYELARVINPFREAIETHYGIDPKSFQDTIVQGLLSTSPIDITAFGQKDFEGNIDVGRAVAQTASGVLPQLARPALEFATGTNAYTGAQLNPDDNTLIENGQVGSDEEITAGDRTFKKRDSRTLRSIADFTGIDQGKLQSVVAGYSGTVGSYLLNGLDRITNAATQEDGPVGGKDMGENFSRRFFGSGTKQSSIDYYKTIDKLQAEKETLMTRLDRIARTERGDTEASNEKRQNLIDDYGNSVGDAVRRYAEYYNRVGGFKPYQADDLIDLLNFGPNQGTFAMGSYQEDDLNTARQDAREDAQRRASNIGLPDTSARDLFGKTTLDNNGNADTSADYTTLANSLIRTRVYNAPKQIIYEAQEIMKADKKNGIPSVYDEKKKYDDQVSELYKQAKGLKGDAATAIYDKISDIQEAYMSEVFDARIKPLVDKYGVEILRNSKIADEVTKYVEVPGDFTPFASKKKQPYLTDDVYAFLKDRYGVGSINQANLKNDAQAEKYLNNINANIRNGKYGRANQQLSDLQQNINEGRIYVNDNTMQAIADTIKARNKKR